MSPGSLRSAGEFYIPTSEVATLVWVGSYPQARFARLGLFASLRDAPDLSEAVAACMILYTPRLATLSWGYLHLFEMPTTSPRPSLLA